MLGFKLTQKGKFAEFLGSKFDYKEDDTIECTQEGMIKKPQIVLPKRGEACKTTWVPDEEDRMKQETAARLADNTAQLVD